MKRLFLFALALSMFSVAHASRPTPHVDNAHYNVKFEVLKCTDLECEYDGALGNNIEIALKQIDFRHDVVTWTGDWSQEVKKDGFDFAASLTVQRTATRHGEDYYTLTANVGPVLNSQEPSHLTVVLKNGANLTDTIKLKGPSLWQGNVEYRPSLLIQAPFPTPHK